MLGERGAHAGGFAQLPEARLASSAAAGGSACTEHDQGYDPGGTALFLPSGWGSQKLALLTEWALPQAPVTGDWLLRSASLQNFSQSQSRGGWKEVCEMRLCSPTLTGANRRELHAGALAVEGRGRARGGRVQGMFPPGRGPRAALPGAPPPQRHCLALACSPPGLPVFPKVAASGAEFTSGSGCGAAWHRQAAP